MSKLPDNLIAVHPHGIGTPYVESLTSFLIRLAKANGITLKELFVYIADDCKIKLNTRGAIDNTFLHRLNTGSRLAQRVIAKIESLTGLKDLKLLTLLKWKDHFSAGLLHKRRWFNPNSKRDYDPLYLSVSPVYWSLEGLPLEQYCHACAKTAVSIQFRHQIGICSHCNTALDQYSSINAGITEEKYTSAFLNYNSRDYSIWVAEAVGEMVAYTGSTAGFNFGESLAEHLKYFGLKNYTNAAKALKISHISIRVWAKDNVAPRFDQFLNLCYCMRTSPMQFFQQELMSVGSPVELRDSLKQTRTAIASSKRKPIDPIALRERLIEDIRSKKYLHLTFNNYCRAQHNRSDVVVRQYEPELAKEFVAQNKSYERHRSRTLRIARIHEVIEAAKVCLDENLNINHKNLRYYISQPGMLMSQWAKDLIVLIKDYGPHSISKGQIQGLME